MPKPKIEMPDLFLFSTDIAVRISDINYGMHVGHDSFLTIAHEARVRFLGSIGATESDVFGGGIILSDACLSYTNESFYGDVINVKIGGGQLRKYGLDLFYLLSEKKRKVEIGRVKTGIVFFDYKQRKVMRVPEKFARTVSQIRARESD